MEQDHNLVEIWLRKDPVRWTAGALAGLVAGAIAMLFAMWFATTAHLEFWFPIKLMGTIALGPTATNYGMDMPSILMGALTFEGLCLILGIIYAHFTGTNRLKALLPMGLVWGIFSWIFTWNLFFQSIKPIRAAAVPSGAVLPVCVVFGLSLATVSLFDRMFRGSSGKR